jgi:hypothetical protein
MLIKRIYIAEWSKFIVMLLTVFSWNYIKEIAEYSYEWILLFASLIVIAITYVLTSRISKERVILSSE